MNDFGKIPPQNLELEQSKRKAYSESRRNNIKGINQHTKKDKKNGHMTSHMENENRNEDIIINKDEIKKPEFNFKNSLIELGIEKQIIEDWLLVRKTKKASNTKTAFDLIVTQIKLSKLSANECIKIAAEQSWSGFKSQWIDNLKTEAKIDNKPYSNLQRL